MMVKPRKFTSTELRDLGRGARLLAQRDSRAYRRFHDGPNSHQYLEMKKLHEELSELCEYWADRLDHKAMLEKRAQLASEKAKASR